MRILLSGGNKTQNIVNAIEKKFKPSGDEFLVVEFLENINDVYSRGDFFDKAIIAEQSINREYSITDEAEIRHRINSFVLDTVHRNKKVSFVFFTQSEQMANMIHEEILPIREMSVVVLKQPPYYANFFTTIIVNDIGQLPSDIVFTPQNIESELPDFDEQGELLDDMDIANNGSMIPDNTGSLGDELFGTEDNFGDGTQIDGLLDPDEMEMPVEDGQEFLGDTGDEFNEDNQGFEGDNQGFEGNYQGFGADNQDWVDQQTGGYEDQGNFGIDDGQNGFTGDQENFGVDNQDWVEQQTGGYEDQGNNSWGGQNNTWNNGFGADDDENIDMDAANNMGDRSGDLPDYTVPIMPTDQQDEPSIQDTVIQGFDTDEDEDLYTEKPVDESFDEMYVPNQGNDYTGEMPVADEYDPLGQDLYDNSNENQNGFDTQNIYNDQGQMSMPNDVGMDAPVQGQNIDEYGHDPGFYENEVTQTSGRQQTVGAPIGKRRKGIGAIIGGGRTSNQQQVIVDNQPQIMTPPVGTKDIRKVKDALRPFASRGNSIVVTGCGGCGTSTVAFNLANIISQIGYTVLLVDMDTEGRSQGYISKACYDSMDVDGSNLMSAVNSSTNSNTNATVVKQGFHLLTMGLATDILPIEEQLHREKIARFVSVIKTGYNFVIYDVPFRHSVNFLSDITFMCDNLVFVVDASNWGITKTMLSVCNIDSDDMQDTIFRRAQLLFNRYRNLNKLFGLRVKTCDDIVRAMDKKVIDLVGDDVGLEFSRMSIAGIINDDPMFENGWYDTVQYSDTKKGQDIFIELLESIVLKKH